MARQRRIAFPGALYHLTNRGNNQQPIFLTDADRHFFLNVLSKVTQAFGWICHAYALMTNHYHLFVQTTLPNISASMQRLDSLYATWFNRAYRRAGHLFQGRFNAVLVQQETHFMEVARYVPLNSVRAGMYQDPADDKWSSFRATAGLDPVPSFLSVDEILGRFGDDRAAAQANYRRFVMEGVDQSIWKDLKNQIFLGNDAFVARHIGAASPLREVPKIQQAAPLPPLADLSSSPEAWFKAIQDGYSQTEIARRSGLHPSTISKRLKKLGLVAGVAGVTS